MRPDERRGKWIKFDTDAPCRRHYRDRVHDRHSLTGADRSDRFRPPLAKNWPRGHGVPDRPSDRRRGGPSREDLDVRPSGSSKHLVGNPDQGRIGFKLRISVEQPVPLFSRTEVAHRLRTSRSRLSCGFLTRIPQGVRCPISHQAVQMDRQ